MDFKSRYIPVFAQKNPKLFMELRRTGKLDAFLQEKSLEAHALKRELLANEPKGPTGHPKDLQAELLAEEQVMAQMLGF